VLDFLNVKQVYLFKKQPTTQPYFLPSHEMSVFKTLPDLPHVSACFFALQARFKSVLAVKTEQKDSHVSRDALCSKSYYESDSAYLKSHVFAISLLLKTLHVS
jgi:hypothetical protein